MTITLIQAKAIVLEHLGDKAAENFNSFFEGESPEEIEKSIAQILTDLLGPEQAQIKLEKLKT